MGLGLGLTNESKSFVSRALNDESLQPLLSGLEPQIVLSYDMKQHTIHRDMYRLMCHAAEATISSQADKERLAALWRDLLRVRRLFNR